MKFLKYFFISILFLSLNIIPCFAWDNMTTSWLRFFPVGLNVQYHDSIGSIFFSKQDSLFYYVDKFGIHPFGTTQAGTILVDTAVFAYDSDTANFAWFADSSNYADTAGYALSCAQLGNIPVDDFLVSFRVDTFKALMSDTSFSFGTSYTHSYVEIKNSPLSTATFYNYYRYFPNPFSSRVSVSTSSFSPSGFNFSKIDTVNGVLSKRYTYNFDYGGIYLNVNDYSTGSFYLTLMTPESLKNRKIIDSITYVSDFIKIRGFDNDTSTYSYFGWDKYYVFNTDTSVGVFGDTSITTDSVITDVYDLQGTLYKRKRNSDEIYVYITAEGIECATSDVTSYFGAEEGSIYTFYVDEIGAFEEDTIQVDNYMNAHVRVADTALYVKNLNLNKFPVTLYAPNSNILYYDTNSSLFGILKNQGISNVPSYIYSIQNILSSEFSSGDTIGIIRINISNYIDNKDTLSNILSDTICLLEEIPNYNGSLHDFEHRWRMKLIWFNGSKDSVLVEDSTVWYGGETYVQDTILKKAYLVSNPIPNIEFIKENQAIFIEYQLEWAGQIDPSYTLGIGGVSVYFK